MVLFVLAAIVFLTIIGIVGYYAKKAAEKRQAELFRLSHNLGIDFMPLGFQQPSRGFWESLTSGFEPSQTESFLNRFGGFYPFGVGDGPNVTNLLVGRMQDCDWYMFDYSYTTQSTDSNGNTSTTTHPFGIVAVRLPIVMPPLKLSPENMFHKVGQVFGKRELTFELEEFNKRYFVECVDRQGAYDVLHPRAIEYLMSRPTRLWQMGGMMIVIAKSGYYESQEVFNVHDEIKGFLQLLPDYVRQDRGFSSRFQGALDG